MKIPRLPETDLARACPLPPDQKRRSLEAVRLGHPPHSYAPVRGSLSDVLNVEAGVFGALPQVPWSKIEENISRRSRSDAEESANLKVARGLFDYVQLQKLSGRRHDILPLSLGASTNLVFWHPVVLLIGGRPLVPFFDPRRAKALTFQARRFVFSVMHERIRAAHPDFAEVTLGIFQFAPSDDGPRAPILHTDEGVELFDFDELDLMVQDTYAMWREVCAVRTMESRRKAGGRGGGFI